jgi:hypothetical protein
MTNVPVMMLWIVVREHERPAGYRKQTRTNTPQRFHPDGRPKKKRPTGKRFLTYRKVFSRKMKASLTLHPAEATLEQRVDAR